MGTIARGFQQRNSNKLTLFPYTETVSSRYVLSSQSCAKSMQHTSLKNLTLNSFFLPLFLMLLGARDVEEKKKKNKRKKEEDTEEDEEEKQKRRKEGEVEGGKEREVVEQSSELVREEALASVTIKVPGCFNY